MRLKSRSEPMGKVSERLIRWWLYFRWGHGTYWSFILAFSQWIIIIYFLAVSEVPLLQRIFPDIWQFAVIFLICYIPASVIAGWLHRHHLMHIESTVGMEEVKPSLMITKASIEAQMQIMEKLNIPIPEGLIRAKKWLEEALKR